MLRTHLFLRWLGPAIVAGAISVAGLWFAAASVWPEAKASAEAVYAAAVSSISASAFRITTIAIVAGYFALLFWTWPQRPGRRKSLPTQPEPLPPGVHIEQKHYIHAPVMPADGRAYVLATCRPGDAAPDLGIRMSAPGSLVFGPMEHMHHVSLLVTNDGDAALIDLDVPFRSRFLENHAAMTRPAEAGVMRFPRLDPGAAARLEVLIENRDEARRALYIVIDDEGEATHSKSGQRLKVRLHHPGPYRITALPFPPFSRPAGEQSPASPPEAGPETQS